MSEANSQPTRDVLDRATGDLRDAPIPAGPPAELTAATVAAINQRLAGTVPSELARQQRRRRIMRFIGYGTATAAAVGLMAVAGVMWTARPAPAAELTAALDNVNKAKSFRHVTKMTFDGKTMFEMTMYKQGERWRFEAGKDIAIVVDEKGNAVQFNHADKTATKLDIEAMQKNRPKPSEEVTGLLKKIRDLKGEGVERIGEETLDGKKTTVYTFKDVELAGAKSDWKVWVDLGRKLPMRMEMTKGNDGAEVVVTSEYSGWNEEFDAKLFSTAVPDGYKLVDPPTEKK